MKTRGLHLLRWFLLGAAVNVAVAWWCAIALDPLSLANELRVGHTQLEGDGHWVARRMTQAGMTQLRSTVWRQVIDYEVTAPEANTIIPAWSGIEPPDPTRIGPARRLRAEVACGWPWPALRYWMDIDGGSGRDGPPPVVHGIPISRSSTYWTQAHALPLHPIPLGFLLNSTIYTAALPILLLPGRALRRRRRPDHSGDSFAATRGIDDATR